MFFGSNTSIYAILSQIYTLIVLIVQGIHLGMGGNLYGPAGTGKTETVKALGSSLGRQVFVFNCDEVSHVSNIND